MGRTNMLERRQSESVGRRNSRSTFLRSDWPRLSCLSKSSLMEAPVDDQCITMEDLGPRTQPRQRFGSVIDLAVFKHIPYNHSVRVL
ncbi:hypothetical protein TNCV_757851 [Trichonephila clavipes]|nr:hypothetical protein TNCV_757851 [Trichonephila clavipes]